MKLSKTLKKRTELISTEWQTKSTVEDNRTGMEKWKNNNQISGVICIS